MFFKSHYNSLIIIPLSGTLKVVSEDTREEGSEQSTTHFYKKNEASRNKEDIIEGSRTVEGIPNLAFIDSQTPYAVVALYDTVFYLEITLCYNMQATQEQKEFKFIETVEVSPDQRFFKREEGNGVTVLRGS
jgi:hypothetical protein